MPGKFAKLPSTVKKNMTPDVSLLRGRRGVGGGVGREGPSSSNIAEKDVIDTAGVFVPISKKGTISNDERHQLMNVVLWPVYPVRLAIHSRKTGVQGML